MSQENLNKPNSQINEGYWIELEKEYLDRVEDNINLTTEKFQKLIIGLWGFYTAVVGIGSGFYTSFLGRSISSRTLLGLILPSVLLLLAYWLTTSSEKFSILEDWSSNEIRSKFYLRIKDKKKFLDLARFLLLISCLVIPITVFFANKTTLHDFEVKRSKKDGDTYTFFISGSIPQGSSYEISLPEMDGNILEKGKADNGMFSEEVSVMTKNKTLIIRLWWKELEGRGSTVERTIQIEDK